MFSAANAKIRTLANVDSLKKWTNGRKNSIYSFDLLSGWSCPYADDCLAKVFIQKNGRRKLKDGPNARFRCFSASQEALHTNAYKKRAKNFEDIRSLKTVGDMAGLIASHLPEKLKICRIHVAGDFFSQTYFDAWVAVALMHPDKLFYAYTKSLKFWVRRMDVIPPNLVLTASRGGKLDHMIDEYNLREAVVVFSEQEAADKSLEIDHDDSHAADPQKSGNDFALLIHGVQQKGSEAAEAVKSLKQKKVKFSYNRKG